MAPVVPPAKADSIVRPRVLVVDDEPNLIELIGDLVRRNVDTELVFASNVSDARRILSTERIELLVTDVHLPDGDGMSLLPTLRKHQPNASAIVITGTPSMDYAISALRGGALDFVPKPFSNQQLVERVRQALGRHERITKQEQRFDRLRVAVKRLNEARRHISKKVDLLCNDLVTAYGELSRQLDGVRTQEGFRKYIAEAKDLEQLLCHAMDWLLRQLGYANVGVWLAADDGEFQLGAYMKYTVAGDAVLTTALKRVLLPAVARENLVRLRGDDLQDKLTPQELTYLKGQDILAVNCTYLGDSLAALVFFRDARSPFNEEDADLLRAVSPIFAVSLATIVRDAEDAEAPEGETPFFNGEAPQEEPPKDKEKKKRKPDPADWWKSGGPPPF